MNDIEVLIIGAGMAGLAAARHCHQVGADYLVVEGADRIGGRVVTDRLDGHLIDRGFQVVNTGYPKLAALADLDGLDLGYFRSGILVRHAGRLERYAHPLRDPAGVPGMLTGLARQATGSGIGTLADHARLARLIAHYTFTAPALLLAEPETTAAEALSELSPGFLDRLVAPYLTGVFADPELRTSSHVLAMIVRSFVRGRIGLPRGGVGAVADSIAAPLPEDRIRLSQPVERLEGTTARTAAGPIRARAVLVATDPVTAARLLPELPEPVMRPLTTVYHSTDRPPLAEPALLLDGDRSSASRLIQNTVVLTGAVPGYAPPGRHLIASTVAAPDADEAGVRAELARLYAVPTDDWTHLTTVRIPQALPETAPPTGGLRRPTDLGDGRHVAGDHRDSPSVQGALASGTRAARKILGRRGDGTGS